MSFEFSIKKALPADRKTLSSFWQQLDTSLPETVFGSSQTGKKKLHQRLARQITTMEHGFALLAWQGNDAIGCISGHIYDKPESVLTPVGIIYNLWVDADCRRQGIARELVRESENRLKRLGAKSFQVAWRNQESARSFWQALGYEGYEVLAGKIS